MYRDENVYIYPLNPAGVSAVGLFRMLETKCSGVTLGSLGRAVAMGTFLYSGAM